MKEVVLKWGRLSVLEKISNASFIVSKMTTNAATFPTPDPPLADISTAISEVAAAENEAKQGGTDRITLRDAKLKTLQSLMNRQVLYVQSVTLGDEVLTDLAGMEVKSNPTPWPIPEKPQNFRATPGKFQGSVYLICNSVQYKKLYVFEMWVDDGNGGGQWQPIATQGKRNYTHEGLERGKTYRFRVRASNSAGPGPYSNEVESYAA